MSNTSSECVRKRSLDDSRHQELKSEHQLKYAGQAKRPKTPVITPCDIGKQIRSLLEQKQSIGISLPDFVCSSVDATDR